MKKKKRAIGSTIGRLSALFIAMLCIMMFALIKNIREMRLLAYECMEDKASLYVEQFGKDIDNLSMEFLVMRVRENKDLIRLPDTITPQESQYYELLQDIRDTNFSRRMLYEGKYSFYEYVDSADFLILDTAMYFPSSRRTGEAEALIGEAKKLIEDDIEGVVWNFLEADGEDYLYGFLQQEGKAVGCIVKLDDLFQKMDITNLGYEGIPFFEKDSQIYTGTGTRNKEELFELTGKTGQDSGMTNDYAWYTYKIKRVGNFKILLVLSRGVLDQIFSIQTLVSILFVLLFVVTVWILMYFYKKILKPMRHFVDTLKNPEEETWLNEKEGNGILELEYASKQFHDMFHELQSLRIAVYEKELMEKKTELEYVQEQVRPHFFLNCLSIIQSMAELHHEEDIVHITEVLSNYMSYVIQDTFELRTLKDELEHIQSYVDIQQIRRPGAFSYEVIMEEGVDQHKIPPLVLQTFVENSLSHALVVGGHIEVTLYLTIENIDGKECLYITLSDTGNGFPEEVLKSLEEDAPIIYNGREHIGIRNTIRRLKILYGDQASVRLCNMAENYGAVVEIMMPSMI